MAKLYCKLLASQENTFVDQSWDSIHLDQVLNIMLFAESCQCQVEFLISTSSLVDPSKPKTAIVAAAAEILQTPEEDVDEEVGI